MRSYDTAADSLDTIRAALTARDTAQDAQAEAVVRAILDDVKARGDAAVLDYTRRFDWPEATVDAMQISSDDLLDTWDALDAHGQGLINGASDQIREFHYSERDRLKTWLDLPHSPRATNDGLPNLVGQLLQPVDRVGVYVPGGKAAYPSTVLMAGLPASAAGVKEIIICTPADREGKVLPLVAAAAADFAKRLFKIGGAQAIAAMAYGTETVPKCDVIVGPGNKYVNTAKRLVYGEVGIDMLAGPSEVAIVADEGANPAFVAADLLAQTEHGPDNKGVLFCSSSPILEQCRTELYKQREQLSRQEILEASGQNLIFVRTRSVDESLDLCNTLAPEHLELMVREPLAVLHLVRNAGAVLLGDHTSAPLGDYWAGPSHTLPTAGAARFSSPLSVATFMKRTSVLYYSKEAAAEAAEDVARFAEAEGFDAHARAARLRKEPPPAR
ncbi:MAG: histidinol dehydrogenase [Armatimonadetes bacterium]|nr:histidinol dehydrogenase [Armatimonadota bacterium]